MTCAAHENGGSPRGCPECAATERVIKALTDGAEAYAVPEPEPSYWSRFSGRLNARLDEQVPGAPSFAAPPGPHTRSGIPPRPGLIPASSGRKVALALAASLIGVLALLARAPRMDPSGGNEVARGVPSEAELLEKLRGVTPDTLDALASSVADASPTHASGGGEASDGSQSVSGASLDGFSGSEEARLLHSALPDERFGPDIELSPYELYDRLGSEERRFLLEVIRGEMG